MIRSRKMLPVWLLFGMILAYLPAQLSAQTPNRAALVVRFGEGNVVTRCIEFSEEQISGYDMLTRSGLNVVSEVQGMGALICSIDQTGCPANNCLCQCQGGGTCIYWSYWHRLDGSWQYSPGGSSVYQVTNGAVEGWSWGPGAANQAIPPPDLNFEDVCRSPATPTSEPTATALPPTPTWTPLPSPTPVREIIFTVDNGVIPSGQCTTLRWQVSNVGAVFLDNVGVSGADTRQVCPAQTETYTLRVQYPGGEESRDLTVTVMTVTPTEPPAADVAPATAAPTDVPPSVTPTGTEPPASVPTNAATTVAAVSPVPPTLTEEIAWITVPPLPTEPAATQALAVVPTATPFSAPAEAAPVEEPAGGASWWPYAVFLALVVLLATLIAWSRRRTVSR